MKTDDNQINVSTGSDGDEPMRTSSPSVSNSSCPALPPVTERQSSAFYVLKGLAIISVICAHFVMGAADGDAAALAEKLRSVCGNLGVPCFFFAAGFFYRRSPRDFAPFWKKKLTTVVLPWFIGACVTFALYSFKDRNFADVPQRFCMWFLGLGSWLYFTTALMFCFAWFKVVTGRVNIWLTVALTVASVYMTRLGLIPYCEWFTAYVNPFNWFGFFGLGILARRSESLRLFEKKRPVLFVFGAALAALGVYGRFLTGKKCDLEIKEIKNPDLDAYLVGMNIAGQIERRVGYRRAMKRAIQQAMKQGAQGIKIAIGGRIGGADIARVVWLREGRVPLQTLRADIDLFGNQIELSE